MIRRAYDVNAKEETGKENFRIKGSLVEQLSVRIKSYVERSRTLVREAMLVPELLEVRLDLHKREVLLHQYSFVRSCWRSSSMVELEVPKESCNLPGAPGCLPTSLS